MQALRSANAPQYGALLPLVTAKLCSQEEMVYWRYLLFDS